MAAASEKQAFTGSLAHMYIRSELVENYIVAGSIAWQPTLKHHLVVDTETQKGGGRRGERG